MCRYAVKTYKSHFVCFECRKTFKQTHIDDILLRIKKDKVYHELNGKSITKVGQVFTKTERKKLEELTQEIKTRNVKCPECGNTMADLGLDFKAPKKTAKKEWEIIKSLYKIGKNFYSCGCDGIGYIPQNHKEHEKYLKAILVDYESNIIYYQNKSIEEYPDKVNRINYWSENAKKIKSEIEQQDFKK